MIVTETVTKFATFSRERHGWVWINEKYPNGKNPRVENFMGDWTASVDVIEYVEYTHLLIPISEIQEKIEKLKLLLPERDHGLDDMDYQTKALYNQLTSILKNSKKVKI